MSEFVNKEAWATVQLDRGESGTRRVCNNENCLKEYNHEGSCTEAPAQHQTVEPQSRQSPLDLVSGPHNEGIYVPDPQEIIEDRKEAMPSAPTQTGSTVTPATSSSQTEGVAESLHLLNLLRSDGWVVAVHNDYRQDRKLKTFWLLTKGNVCLKGEGDSDYEALRTIWQCNSGANVTLPTLPSEPEYVPIVTLQECADAERSSDNPHDFPANKPLQAPASSEQKCEHGFVFSECKICRNNERLGVKPLMSDGSEAPTLSTTPTDEQIRQAREIVDRLWEILRYKGHGNQRARDEAAQLLATYRAEAERGLREEVQWWKDHAVVILDKGEKKLCCYLKGAPGEENSMCVGIDAENRRLANELTTARAEVDKNKSLIRELRDLFKQSEKDQTDALQQARAEAIREERRRCAEVAKGLQGASADQIAQAIEADAPGGELVGEQEHDETLRRIEFNAIRSQTTREILGLVGQLIAKYENDTCLAIRGPADALNDVQSELESILQKQAIEAGESRQGER